MHDTLKKPREILMVSYAVRFPELAAKSKTLGGEVDMDPMVSPAYSVKQSYSSHSDSRTRSPAAACRGTFDIRDNLFQLHFEDAFSLRFQIRPKTGGYVLNLYTRSR